MFRPASVVVPNPDPDIENADVDVVAIPATVVVDRYRFPPAFLIVHCGKPAPAERDSCGAVVEDNVNKYCDVLVPTPNVPLVVFTDTKSDPEPF